MYSINAPQWTTYSIMISHVQNISISHLQENKNNLTKRHQMTRMPSYRSVTKKENRHC
jgi:hypothetical protein